MSRMFQVETFFDFERQRMTYAFTTRDSKGYLHMKILFWGFAFWMLALQGMALGNGQTPVENPWAAHAPGPSQPLNHEPWQRFLRLYLDTSHASGFTMVDYARVTAEDKGRLENYLSALQQVKVSKLSRAEQKAYWINLYNALTVAIVLRHYPVASILDIQPDANPSPNKKGPWDALLAQVEGRKISLNAIENGILRPIWKDSYVHFGLNCASYGCPDLAPSVYTARNTDSLLRVQANRFLQTSRGIHFDQATLVLSSLFQWYASDFGKDEKAVIKHLATMVNPDMQKRMLKHGGPIRYHYDWALNDAKRP